MFADEREDEENSEYVREKGDYRGVFSIKNVLGAYYTSPKIHLYDKGIKWSVERFEFNEEMLRAVVIVHELGHWVSHLLPKYDVPTWDTKSFNRAESKLKEGWAQLITAWVAEEIGGEFKETFYRLNDMQSYPYRVFKKFKGYRVRDIMKSLEILREISQGNYLRGYRELPPMGFRLWENLMKDIS